MPSPQDASRSDARPAWPWQLGGRAWRYLLRRAGHEFSRSRGIDQAAALTFFAVLSVFPAALAVVSVIGVVGDGPATASRVLDLVEQVAPGQVADTLRGTVTRLASTPSAPAAFIGGVVVALWSASTYVSAFGRAMNVVYQVEEGRPFWRRKLAQLAVTVLLVLLVTVVAAIVAVSGPVLRWVGELAGVGEGTVQVWQVVRWPVLAVAVIAIVAVLYATTGNVTKPRVRWLSLGAVLAIAVIGVASAGFGIYVSLFAKYDDTFGALAGVIVFIIWLFLIDLALVLGAHLNAEIERARELLSGEHSERRLQLPVRDDTTTSRTALTERLDHERAELLREGKPLPLRPDTLPRRIRRRIETVWGWLREHSPRRRPPT